MVFTDNWGKLMASIFVVPTTTSPTFTMDDLVGTTRSYVTYKDRDFDDHWNQPASQSFAQVGQGSTPAARSDFKIETPFTNGGPEDNLKITSLFGYNSALGKITITTSIGSTAGSGTVTEVVKINAVQQTNATLIQNLFIRNIVTPEPFIAAKTINLEHIILI